MTATVPYECVGKAVRELMKKYGALNMIRMTQLGIYEITWEAESMDYKGYELRFGVRWLVHGVTHSASVGVFKNGQMLAPCADIHIAQRYIDARIKLDERLGRVPKDGKERSKRDTKSTKSVRK